MKPSIGTNLAWRAHVLAFAVLDALVAVVFVQQAIAAVLIGCHKRNVIGNSGSNETVQGAGVGILDDLSNDHALASDSADHGDLASGASTIAALGEVLIALFAADKGFVTSTSPPSGPT